MNRRGFLGALAAGAAAFALDPDRALWVPGAKTISIPRQRDFLCLRWSDGTPFQSGIAIRNYFRELDRLNMLPRIGDTISVPRPPRFIPWQDWAVPQELFSVTMTPDLIRDLDLPTRPA